MAARWVWIAVGASGRWNTFGMVGFGWVGGNLTLQSAGGCPPPWDLSTPHDVQKLPMASHAKDRVRSCPRAGCGKSARTVVCPTKLGASSSRRGLPQQEAAAPVVLDGQGYGQGGGALSRTPPSGSRTSHRAVTTVNAESGSKVGSARKYNSCNREDEGDIAEPKYDDAASFTSAGWKRQHGDKDMPSNWRSPPRPEEKSSEQGRSYNRLNREVDRRREGDGWVRSSVEAG